MLKNFRWLSGLALASLVTVAVPSVFPLFPAQALTATNAATTRSGESTRSKQVARIQRSGQIKVTYGKVSDPLSALLLQGYREYGLFEQTSELITSEINLPRDINLVLEDCGMANAYYHPSQHKIVICNELTSSNYQLLRQHGYGEKEALKTAIFSSIFTFYHEAGHMLIHELNLPTVGNEEENADQFSAFFLLTNDDNSKTISGDVVMAAAKVFKLENTGGDIGEHPSGKRRFYNLVCMLYGVAPDKYSRVVNKLNYDQLRLARCQIESQSIVTNWKRLLQAYIK